jgi:hypothetical protein
MTRFCLYGGSREGRSGSGLERSNCRSATQIECQSSFRDAIARPRPSDFVRKAAVHRLETRLDLEARITPRWPEQVRPDSAQPVFGPRWFAFGASGYRRPKATKIASGLALEGAGYGRHASWELLRKPGHPHDREAKVGLGPVLRDQVVFQEPWNRSPPDLRIRGRLRA